MLSFISWREIAEKLNGMKMVKTTPFNIFGHPNLTFSLLKAILEPKKCPKLPICPKLQKRCPKLVWPAFPSLILYLIPLMRSG